jgi:hypothetical protein
MAKASVEADLRDVLAGIDIPTLLLYDNQGGRAPRLAKPSGRQFQDDD